MSREGARGRVKCFGNGTRWFDAGDAGGFVDAEPLGILFIDFLRFCFKFYQNLWIPDGRAIPLTSDRYAQKPFLIAVLLPFLGKIREFGQSGLVCSQNSRYPDLA